MPDKDFIPPQGLEKSWRGIMPPQGVTGVVGIAEVPPYVPSPPEDWLSGWGHRKSITILGTDDGAVQDYQMFITVHKGAGSDTVTDIYCGGDCRDDFADIRFTASDMLTVLEEWARVIVSGDYAEIWFKADTIPIDPNTNTFYLYYKNPTAPAVWDFDATMIFGDPFDNVALDGARWTSVTGNPTYSIDDASHYLEVTDMDDDHWLDGMGFHSKAITLPSQYVVEDAYVTVGNGYRINANTSSTGMFLFGLCLHHDGWDSLDYGVVFAFLADFWAGISKYYAGRGVGGNTDQSQEYGTAVHNYYHRYKKLAGNCKVDGDGINKVDEANAETPDICHIMIAKYLSNDFGLHRLYAFLIRQYADPEPSITAIGAEESP